MPDFFTRIADLISGTSLQDGALYILSNIPGFPPIIQTVHILGVAVVMGTIVMLNLRILGWALPSQQLSEMIKRLMPWFWCALASNLVSGAVFVLARPNRYFNNPIFGWKVSFLIPAVLLALFFHLMSRQQDGYWEFNQQRRLIAKAIALISLCLWILVPMAGRWIAYVEYIYYPA